MAHEVSLLRPIRGMDPERLVARWSAAVLGLFGFVALLPAWMLPNGAPLIVAFGCTLAVLIARIPATSIRFDIVTPFSVLFGAVGLLYVAASALEILPAGNLRPVRQDYIFRHSFFILLWIPLMAGSTAMFRNVWPDMARIARRVAVPVLAILAVLDVVTAYAWGDPERLVWEEYTAFFDPPTLTFVYSACFFLYVAFTRRIALPLAIATAHWAVSSIGDHGMMYNTMTGSFVLVCMWVFALTIRRSPQVALFCVLALGGGLIFGLIAGAAAPAMMGFDINTHWRFLVWRENLFAALDSGLIGVGFGTPYYELSAGNIYEAFRLSRFAEFTLHALSSPMDILYVRGQHSSFVNAFYRMGLLGGGALIAFNVAVLVGVLRALRSKFAGVQFAAAGAGALFIIEASQIAMHVGIESPRYFTVYALAVGLARGVSNFTPRENDV